MKKKEEPDPQRLPAIVLSLLFAALFGAAGLYALINHSVSWPNRSGGVGRLTGSVADMFGWVLLACMCGCLSQLALALRPGAAGKWVIGIFTVWALAAAVYHLAR